MPESKGVKVEGYPHILPVDELVNVLNQLENSDGHGSHTPIKNKDIELFLISNKFAERSSRSGCARTKKTKKLLDRLHKVCTS